VGVAAAIAAVVVLLPSHGGPPVERPLFYASQMPTFPPADREAINATRQLPGQFLTIIQQRSNLAYAYELLSPDLRSKFSLREWRAGRGFPFRVPPSGPADQQVAFAGKTSVGYVVAHTLLDANRHDQALYAIRLSQQAGQWRIDYLHFGWGTPNIGAYNYAPSGFVPGIASKSFGSYAPLLAALAGLVILGVLFERMMSRRSLRKPQ
jgi:hypothetical protein